MGMTFLVSACAAIHGQAIQKAQEKGHPIAITEIRSSLPNSAGGVDAYVNFVNATDNREFRYVRFRVTPYNRVGDVAPSSIGQRDTTWLRSTGPYGPGGGNSGALGSSYWENVWYNHSIRCIEVDEIEVEFFTDDKVTIGDDEVHEVVSDRVSNSCAYR